MKTIKSKFFQIIARKESLLFLVLFIAGLSLLGWLFCKIIFASFSLTYIPIAPATAVTFIVLSILLLSNKNFEKARFLQSISTPLVLFVALFCLFIFLNYFFNFTWDIENVFVKNPERLGNVLIGRMSPITSLLFIFACISVLSIRQNNSNIIKYIGGSFSLLVCLISSVLLIGYLYKAPLLYGGQTIPVALPTAICFLLFSITLLRVFELQFWTFNLIKKNTTELQLLKSFLPIVVFIVILQGFLITNLPFRYINPTLSAAFILLLVVIIVIPIVIKVSANLGSQLLRAEKELRKSEERFKTMFSEAPLGIAFINSTTGHIIDVNPMFAQIAGRTEEQMSSIDWMSITHPDDIQEDLDNMSLMNAGKIDGFQMEKRYLKPDGKIVWINMTIAPVNFYNKSNPRHLCMIEDINKRKQTELELIRAKEKAEESDQLKSAFLTNMSHEIRTPMNGILGFTELLREPNLSSDDQQDYIQTIQISGARMLNTLNNIVDISKIESGLTKVDIYETNLNEKIEFTYKFFKPEVEIKGLRFLVKISLPTNEAIINTDNEKVYAILTNLVKNAIKFTFEGSIEFGYEKKGEYIEFFVKDTGVGIPQNQKEIIFERFRQGSESHNRGYEGSGLGLSISKSYVEMLGGEIWVESEEGIGSTFYFTIPYNPVTVEEIETIDVVPTEHQKVEIRKLKILIVEDDEISYSLLSKTLQKISKEVLHTITGVQAVEACRNNPDIDLVLMDIRMPQMDGLEATRQIRQFNKDVIIIAQTAYAFAGDSEKAVISGCNDYISKPINKTLLYELIKKHTNK